MKWPAEPKAIFHGMFYRNIHRIIVVAAFTLFSSPVFAQVSASAPAQGLAQATPAAASSLSVVGPHTLLGFTVTASAAGFVMSFDAATAPDDGVVSPGNCFPMPAPISAGQGVSVSMANTPIAVPVVNGITIVYSTGADCYHKVGSSTAYISVIYQ